jgi:hypothetical protein
VTGPSNGSRCTASQWLVNNAVAEVDVPLEAAWTMWEDRERIPKWMPWIKSVIVQPDDPRMSKWTLSTYQFNQQWEFSWLALNLTPLKNQKIHWRSVQGSTGGSFGGGLEVANRGQIRFQRLGKHACTVKLTIEYEVPNALAPFATVSSLIFFVDFFLLQLLCRHEVRVDGRPSGWVATIIEECDGQALSPSVPRAAVDPGGRRRFKGRHAEICKVRGGRAGRNYTVKER